MRATSSCASPTPPARGRFCARSSTRRRICRRSRRRRAGPSSRQSFLNVGITAAGLAALGQPLDGFPAAFRRGATDPRTAQLVGDVGDSAPSQWLAGFADGARAHLVLSLWVHRDPAVLEEVSAVVRGAFGGALEELAAQDASALPDNQVHFGYRDNISQPTVQGAPPPKRVLPDRQPVAPTGEFLLGYPSQNRGAILARDAAGAVAQLELRGLPAARAGRRRLRGLADERRPAKRGSIASCWPRRSAGAGAAACRSCSPRTPARPTRRWRPSA